MLNLMLKSGEGIQIGEDIIVKVKSDCRTAVAIDAPKTVNIKRLPADNEKDERHEKHERHERHGKTTPRL